MSRTVRRSALAAVLTVGALAAGPAALAMADDYAPATPSPSVAGVKASTGGSVPGAGVAVAGSGVPAVDSPAVASVGGAALPRTGADVAVWTLTGSALVIGGSAMVVASRRRRTARH